MTYKEFFKKKKQQLEEFRTKRETKQRLKTQVDAELTARRLESQAARDEKLLVKLERQAKAKKTIDKVTKFQEKNKTPSRFTGVIKAVGGLQQKARASGIGQGNMFSGSDAIGGNLFGKPKATTKTKRKKRGKNPFSINF